MYSSKKKIILLLCICINFIGLYLLVENNNKKEVILNSNLEFKMSDTDEIVYYINVGTENKNDYIMQDQIPPGYQINKQESYCLVNDTKKYNVLDYDYKTNTFYLNTTVNHGMKCYLYFDKIDNIDNNIVNSDFIIANSEQGKGEPNFANSSCSKGCHEATVGLFSKRTSLGVTYYFRGDVKDNYVKFAGFYWKIIRINESGSLRLIYQGRTVDDNGNNLSIYNSGKETILPTRSNYTKEAKIGFMYSSDKIRGNNLSSNIKQVLDEWYSSNLIQYGQYMDESSGFCGDRHYKDNSDCHPGNYQSQIICTDNGDRWEKRYSFGPRVRNGGEDPNPSFECIYNDDLYTIKNNANVGNQALDYPIGLITADEVVYAGGLLHDYYGERSYQNKYYYLYNNWAYWTISLSSFSDSAHSTGSEYSDYLFVDTDGKILNTSGNYPVDHFANINGVRPVINVKVNNLSMTGLGTITDPYVIQ